jgi:hypothetical protein
MPLVCTKVALPGTGSHHTAPAAAVGAAGWEPAGEAGLMLVLAEGSCAACRWLLGSSWACRQKKTVSPSLRAAEDGGQGGSGRPVERAQMRVNSPCSSFLQDTLNNRPGKTLRHQGRGGLPSRLRCGNSRATGRLPGFPAPPQQGQHSTPDKEPTSISKIPEHALNCLAEGRTESDEGSNDRPSSPSSAAPNTTSASIMATATLTITGAWAGAFSAPGMLGRQASLPPPP